MDIFEPTLEDIEGLIPLWKEQFDYHQDLDAFYYVPFSERIKVILRQHMKEAITTQNPHIWAMKIDEVFVGYATFKIEDEKYFDTHITRYGVIIELYVSQTYRGKGLGKAFLEKIEKDFFKPNKIEHIRLMASEFNHSARDFYKKIGYIPRQVLFYKKI